MRLCVYGCLWRPSGEENSHAINSIVRIVANSTAAWDMVTCLSNAEIEQLIHEDVPYGDLTTHLAGIGARGGRVAMAAREPMVVCGSEEAQAIFGRLDAQVSVRAPSGAQVEPGALLLEARGAAAALFAGWKIAQTLMEWASGVASATAQLRAAAAAAAPRIIIACTRKTVPFTRRLSIKAVHAGGGAMHRTGLSDSVLLFPEHRMLAPDQEMSALLEKLRRLAPERSIVIEVTSVADALAAAAHADVLQLEKFPVAAVCEVVQLLDKRADGRPIIAAAGGINPANAGLYAATGIDVLVSSWPYTAPPRDVQVTFSAA
jgi:molybdenum transport protein